MKIELPENIKKYVEDETTVPLIPFKHSLWYSITQEEKDALQALVKAIDSIPENEWRTWDEREIMKWCAIGNNAARIVRNCIIRSTTPE